MTFALVPAWIAWSVLVAAAAAAAAVFIIRPRPPRRVVSSLLVWRRVLDDARERSLWDRIRWYVSLALAVLIAAALAVAWARPVVGPVGTNAGRMLVVLDSSWSMLASTGDGSTRWDRAVGQARALVRGAGEAEVALATTAEGVVEGPTADRAVIEGALDRLRPTGAAEGAWPRVTGAETVHFISDGARPRPTDAAVTVHSVFDPVPNVAVSAFDVQPAALGGGQADVFVAVVNHATAPQALRLQITRGAAALLDRTVTLRAGQSHHEALTVAAVGEPRFRAEVSAAENALAIDDVATAWLAAAAPLNVAVVGAASPIPKLLAADPGLRVFSAEPAAYAQTKADVWVFDRWLPDRAPAQPALVFDAPASPWFGQRGADEALPTWRPVALHDVLEGVDVSMLDVVKGHATGRPQLEAIAVSERNTPLVSVEDSATARYVVVGFSTDDSNLSLTPAFPILVGNAIEWLGRPARGARRLPGPVVLPAATVGVLAPDGRPLPFARLADRVTATLPFPGLYLVDAAGTRSVITVSLGDPGPSNLLVSGLRRTTEARANVGPSTAAWWRYAAILALVFVVVEWATWQRRITV